LFLELIDQRHLALPVTGHGALQILQVRHMGYRSGALGKQSGLFRLFGGHGIRNAGRGFCRLGLAAFQQFQLLTGFHQLLGEYLNFCLLGCQTLPVGALPAAQGFLNISLRPSTTLMRMRRLSRA
ncbi:MAG: hypothetical protein II265_08980, partial [Clostridia bacterium]|nr:hypothetical protein [Clostridia bacterium]